MALDPLSYLETLQVSLEQAGAASESVDLVKSMRDQYGHRWWHEVAVSMLDAFEYPFVREAAADLHKYVAMPIRMDMSSSHYIRIVYVAVQNLSSKDEEDGLKEAMAVLDSAATAMIGNNQPQGKRAIDCLRALLMMASGPSLEAQRTLDDVAEFLKTLQPHQIEPVLQAVLSKAQCRRHELTSDYTEFYNGVFLMLSHCERAEMVPSEDELAAIAYKTAIAALLSKTVFSFGELLSKESLVDRLVKSNEKWILDLVREANAGNVASADALTVQASASSQEIRSDLDELKAKYRLMALQRLAFYTRADSRVFSFADIASKCSTDSKEVEKLVLEALAKKIIEGKVDGLEELVTITWVQPRVVDKDDIRALAQRVAEWKDVVKGIRADIAKMADEIPS